MGGSLRSEGKLIWIAVLNSAARSLQGPLDALIVAKSGVYYHRRVVQARRKMPPGLGAATWAA